MIAQKAIHIPQDKVRVLQRKLYRAAKENPRRKFGVLYDKVYRKDVLMRAWSNVKANGGAAGVDAQTIAEVKEYGAERLLDEIADALRGRRYRPSPVRRVYIPKPGGRQRPLGIPTVSTNCTGPQYGFGMGGDPTSVSSASRPALRNTEEAPHSGR